MFLIVVCRKCVFHHSPAHTYPNNSTLSRNCTHGSAVRALCPSLSRCLLLLLVLFTCFWLHWACVAARELSLVAASRGYSLVAAYRLRIAVASLVAEHRLRVFTRYSARASLPRSMWNLPRSGIEPGSPALAGGFLTTRPPGKSPVSPYKALVTSLLNSCPKQVSSYCLKGTILDPHLPPALFYRNKNEGVCSLRILGHNQSPPRSRTDSHQECRHEACATTRGACGSSQEPQEARQKSRSSRGLLGNGRGCAGRRGRGRAERGPRLCPQMSAASWPRSPSPWPPQTSPPTTSAPSSSTTHW